MSCFRASARRQKQDFRTRGRGLSNERKAGEMLAIAVGFPSRTAQKADSTMTVGRRLLTNVRGSDGADYFAGRRRAMTHVPRAAADMSETGIHHAAPRDRNTAELISTEPHIIAQATNFARRGIERGLST